MNDARAGNCKQKRAAGLADFKMIMVGLEGSLEVAQYELTDKTSTITSLDEGIRREATPPKRNDVFVEDEAGKRA